MTFSRPDIECLDLAEISGCRFPESDSGMIRIAKETWSRQFYIDRRNSDRAAVLLITGGSGMCEVGGNRHMLQRGDVFTRGPGDWFAAWCDPAEPLRLSILVFHGEDLVAGLQQAMGRTAAVLRPANMGELQTAFDLIYQPAMRRAPHWTELANSLLPGFLQLLRSGSSALTLPASRAEDSARRCRAFIDEQYRSMSTTRQAAKACSLNYEHMSRLFRRFFDTSPHQYLLQRKMDHAAGLLLTTGLQVQEVGREVGYENPYLFSRAFKRVIGLAPNHYRNRASYP